MNGLIYEIFYNYMCRINFSQFDVCISLFVVYFDNETPNFDGSIFRGFISGCFCFLLKRYCFASEVKHLYFNNLSAYSNLATITNYQIADNL